MTDIVIDWRRKFDVEKFAEDKEIRWSSVRRTKYERSLATLVDGEERGEEEMVVERGRKELYTYPGGGGRGEPPERAGTQWTMLEAPTMVGQHPSTSMVFHQPLGNPSPATLPISKKCTAQAASPAAKLLAISPSPSANSGISVCAVQTVSPLLHAVVVATFSLISIGF